MVTIEAVEIAATWARSVNAHWPDHPNRRLETRDQLLAEQIRRHAVRQGLPHAAALALCRSIVDANRADVAGAEKPQPWRRDCSTPRNARP